MARLLFQIARSRFGEFVVGWSFEHMTDFMPVSRILETDRIIAFRHPVPMHKVHILIAPKRKVRSLLELKDEEVVNEIVRVVQRLVNDLRLEKKGYRLIVNGGSYQDVRQLHFHLISDD